MPFGPGIFSPEGATVAALLVLRITALVWMAPVFSSRTVPATVKTGIILLLVVILWPSAMSFAGPSLSVSAPAVLSELLIGLTLGLAAGIFIAAAEAAGDMLAVQMGLSGANVLNPMTSTQMPVLGQFLGLFATALILAVGGHVTILHTLGASLQVLPPGGPLDLEVGLTEVLGLGSTMLWLGLRFAAPVIAAIMISNVALGILARTVPQLNLLMVAFPIQIGVGLFVLAATLPLMADSFRDWPGIYQGMAGGLLEALATDGRP